MSAHVTPPASDGERRRKLAVRLGLAVSAVVVAVVVGAAGYVDSAPTFTVDEPRPQQPAAAGSPLAATGSSGDIEDGSLWVLAVQRGPGGGDVYTTGARVTVAGGRWTGSVTPPAARPDAPVSVVVVRSDTFCGRQLATMSDPAQGAGRFYGPVPPGCTVLATVPVQVTAG